MHYTVDVKNVTKEYRLYRNNKQRLLDLLFPSDYGETFYALKDVTFQAKKGETIGFVGINGSGKSTLLNVIAGITPQTKGELTVNGETSLLAVASGMKGGLTGRENLRLKCLMLGFSEEEIQEMEPSIVAFAELNEFIDQPVKKYSSGMKARLGFAISAHIDPDILIIDEAIATGDKIFAKKCLDKINAFKESGKTILFVSHSSPQIKQFCDKVLWLEYGRVKAFGPADEIMKEYDAFVAKHDKLSDEEKSAYRKEQMNKS